MLRTLFAMSVAGLLFSAIPQNAQAAPISPLSAGIAAHLSDVTEARWRGRCTPFRRRALHPDSLAEDRRGCFGEMPCAVTTRTSP